jgi:NitT/TauT family transport system ATP-binding protein
MTTVLVTHSIDEALRLADRLVVLNGSPASVVGDFPIAQPRPQRLEDAFSTDRDNLRIAVRRLLSSCA